MTHNHIFQRPQHSLGEKSGPTIPLPHVASEQKVTKDLCILYNKTRQPVSSSSINTFNHHLITYRVYVAYLGSIVKYANDQLNSKGR